MTHNQRIKLLEAIKILQDIASAGVGEQLPLIEKPKIADISRLAAPTQRFISALYRTYGMNSINPRDEKVRQIQAETGMMRIDGFFYTMLDRGIIETTVEVHGKRERIVSFRFIKTIPQ